MSLDRASTAEFRLRSTSKCLICSLATAGAGTLKAAELEVQEKLEKSESRTKNATETEKVTILVSLFSSLAVAG